MILVGEVVFGIPIGTISTLVINRAVDNGTIRDVGIIIMWVLAVSFALGVALRNQPSPRATPGASRGGRVGRGG